MGVNKHERIRDLKLYKDLANKVLADNKQLKSDAKYNWIISIIDANITKLTEIIKNLNSERTNNTKLDEYCHNDPTDWVIHFKKVMEPMFMISNISDCAVPGSILYDLNWLKYITADEKVDIALGEKLPNILEKYWDVVATSNKKIVLPFFLKSKSFTVQAGVINEAIDIAKSKSYLISNIALFTVIESLVRELARNVCFAQKIRETKLDANKFVDNAQSLEGLIHSKLWKNDIPVLTTQLVSKYSYLPEKEILDAVSLLKKNKESKVSIKKLFDSIQNVAISKDEEDNEISNSILRDIHKVKEIYDGCIDIDNHTTLISLRIRLHFLSRRYKDDRNSVLHGSYDGFDSKWKNYIYLSAIEEVYNVIKEYESIYDIDF